MVSFVGAGCGAADLITVRGMRLLQEADLVIYAGSLVNPELLSYTKKGCECLNSAYMTLDEVIDALQKGEEEGKKMDAGWADMQLDKDGKSLFLLGSHKMQKMDTSSDALTQIGRAHV